VDQFATTQTAFSRNPIIVENEDSNSNTGGFIKPYSTVKILSNKGKQLLKSLAQKNTQT
jgi:hypothetical protein